MGFRSGLLFGAAIGAVVTAPLPRPQRSAPKGPWGRVGTSPNAGGKRQCGAGRLILKSPVSGEPGRTTPDTAPNMCRGQ